jgi:hypothetical protein
VALPHACSLANARYLCAKCFPATLSLLILLLIHRQIMQPDETGRQGVTRPQSTRRACSAHAVKVRHATLRVNPRIGCTCNLTACVICVFCFYGTKQGQLKPMRSSREEDLHDA